MIEIVPYNSRWPEEFSKIGQMLRQTLGALAKRIDHIGSTAVPSLSAKNIIDIQVSVDELSPSVEAAINQAGFKRLEHITGDHVPPGASAAGDEWSKWIFNPVDPGTRVNLHVRLSGRANQRYALLFRDYLRSHPAVAEAYSQIKIALAAHQPNNVHAYYEVKDPVCDIIIFSAEAWATAIGWNAGSTNC